MNTALLMLLQASAVEPAGMRLTLGHDRFGFCEHGIVENGGPAAPPLTYELGNMRP